LGGRAVGGESHFIGSCAGKLHLIFSGANREDPATQLFRPFAAVTQIRNAEMAD